MITLVGIVTLSGLIGSLIGINVLKGNSAVRYAWFSVVALFCIVNVTHFVDAPDHIGDLAYMIPAFAMTIVLMYLFRDKLCACVGMFCGCFVFNALGNYYDLDLYMVWGIDFLDVVVWTQIIMLLFMAKHFPDQNWTGFINAVKSALNKKHHQREAFGHGQVFNLGGRDSR